MPRVYVSQSGGGSVSDIPYGSVWEGVTGVAPSKNAVYNEIQTIGYVPGNTAYVNQIGGNDSNAVLGNILKPFKTIGAAITAMGLLQNSAIYVDAGSYTLTDADTPYGLKAPGSYYDMFLNPGVTISYYGTYGVWISDGNTYGNLWGDGYIYSYSSSFTGAVDTVNNYNVNIGCSTVAKYVQANTITNHSTSNTSGNIRVGTSTGTGVVFYISGRIQSDGGIPFFADSGSRSQLFECNYIVSGSMSNGLMTINNPAQFTCYGLINSAAYGQYVGMNQIQGITIFDNTGNSLIQFINCNITAVETNNIGYALIFIYGPGSGQMPNLLFQNCVLRNRQSTAYTKAGYSFQSAANLAFKIQDTYADSDINGVTTITNVLYKGNGFMYDTNL